MREIKSIDEMRSFAQRAKSHSKKLSLVPTMGALHEGHLSLVAEAKKRSDIVVVSIFVNPIQFGENEDFSRYPRDLKRDKKLLQSMGVDALFLPQGREMYPEGFKTMVEVKGLSEKLCGRSRPDHFRGVTTVVTKLFAIVSPDCAFFGQKDYQQQAIIRQMVKDLNLPVEIAALPTVREFDGLALSSRNSYLSPEERKKAAMLYQTLTLAKDEIKKGERDARKILSRAQSLLFSEPSIRLDYLQLVDPQSLEEVKKVKGPVVIALAAYIGKTRLIDNLTTEAE